MSNVFEDLQEAKRAIRLYANGLRDGGERAKEVLKQLKAEWPYFVKSYDGWLHENNEERNDYERRKRAGTGNCLRTGRGEAAEGGGPKGERPGCPKPEGGSAGGGRVLHLGSSIEGVWNEPGALQEHGKTIRVPDVGSGEEDSAHSKE